MSTLKMELSNKTLYSVATPVEVGTDVHEIADAMLKLMRDKKGCGLAATQVGLSSRIIYLSVSDYVGAIINPVITKKSGLVKSSVEGCLSFPSQTAKLKRDQRITLEGFDLDWNPVKKNLKGFSAYAAQHEIDHLNGITIIK